MSEPEWGIKRVCPSCSIKYYDFNKNPTPFFRINDKKKANLKKELIYDPQKKIIEFHGQVLIQPCNTSKI